MLSNDIVVRDREVLGGTPVFAGTRVPAKILLDYLTGGQSIEEFLDDFPSVQRSQVLAILASFATEITEVRYAYPA